jgi:glycosyltransferase involved in cell wall biosynthesis
MRVGLDTNAIYVTRAGAARFIRGLQLGFSQLQERNLEVIELAWPVENFEYRQPHRALKTLYREILWARFIAPRLLAKQKIDLFHSAAAILVTPGEHIRHVATLHDLAVIRHPERFRRWHLHAARKQLGRLGQADRVICGSEFSAQEAVSLLGLSRSRISVVYYGCEFQSLQAPPVEQPPEGPLPPEFFLFVGSLEPGKNLALVKAAYELAEQQGETLPPLFIVGARWEGVANEGPPPAQWHYLGRQPDAVLVYLYRRALALLFPSKYEGFGFPVVEAMALGCPVVCSRVASLPEVGGEAALYAELSPAAYLDAMQRLLRETALRTELVAQGYAQAGKFTWKKCAEETLAIYREVCHSLT